LAVSTRLRLFYLFHFSKPIADRPIYRAVHENRVQSVLEIGIGVGQRAKRLIELAALHAPASQIRYAAIDLFEARPAEERPRLSVKAAHQLLVATGAKIKLLPGDPLTVLSRAANCLGPVDLMVVSPGQDAASLASAWFFVPRMLHKGSRVYLADGSNRADCPYRVLTLADVEVLAAKARPRRAA
jgi:hypothetical protein